MSSPGFSPGFPRRRAGDGTHPAAQGADHLTSMLVGDKTGTTVFAATIPEQNGRNACAGAGDTGIAGSASASARTPPP
ncbi:hypothetical protein [Nonomuraea fuscirosea]|uniref:hypothetical protein n=1 Tax=Nonomuraea fuscirosea TaxID=1291556 RepID=UPI003432B2D5